MKDDNTFLDFEFYILGEPQIHFIHSEKYFLNFLGKCAIGLTVRKALVPTAVKPCQTVGFFSSFLVSFYAKNT